MFPEFCIAAASIILFVGINLLVFATILVLSLLQNSLLICVHVIVLIRKMHGLTEFKETNEEPKR